MQNQVRMAFRAAPFLISKGASPLAPWQGFLPIALRDSPRPKEGTSLREVQKPLQTNSTSAWNSEMAYHGAAGWWQRNGCAPSFKGGASSAKDTLVLVSGRLLEWGFVTLLLQYPPRRSTHCT
eukprot:2505951-Amphidinium_carterae.1